jgi:hypothetical protein
LLSTQSIGRQEPGAPLVGVEDGSDPCPYSKLLYIGFRSSRLSSPKFTCCHEVSNAVGVDWKATPKALAVKKVSQFSVDVEATRQWITYCLKNYNESCVPEASQLFQSPIRLIDCHENRRIEYTGEPHIEYLCLSYVWGAQLQHVVLEGDAMKFVQDIGQRYLWVDSVSLQKGIVC